MAATTFVLLRLIAFAFVVAATVSDNSISTVCKQSRCGDAVKIAYPFWVDHAGHDMMSGSTGAAHCGYPSLGLECRRDMPVLQLPSGEYGVANIDYSDRTMRVFDLAVTTGDCPRDLGGRNVTLPPASPPPLSMTSKDTKLTFFLNCSFVGVAARYTVPCLHNTYVFRDGDGILPNDFAGLCQEVVAMPVVNATDNVVAALKSGFELKWWPAADGECAECEQRGGKCGYVWDTARRPTNFSCFFNRISATPPAPATPGSNRSRRIIIAIGLTLSILLTMAIFVSCSYVRRKRLAGQVEGH